MLPSKSVESSWDLPSDDNASQLAKKLWAEMDNEKLSYWAPSGKSSMSPEYKMPGLNISALGLQALNETTMLLFSGANVATLPYDALKHQSLDGSRFAYLGGAGAGSVELHWGPQLDQRYILGQRPDRSWVAEYFSVEANGRIYTDYHFRSAGGDLETVYHRAPDTAETARKIRFSILKNGTLAVAGTGARPSDHFALITKNKGIQGDTGILIADNRIESGRSLSSDPQIETARYELLKAFENKHTDEWTKYKFEANLMRLESFRLQQIEEQLRCQGNSAAKARQTAIHQISETYEQVRRLLQKNTLLEDKSVDATHGQINTKGRMAAACAEQIIDHAANPSEITQGRHPTCTAATLESRLYTRTPSQAARLVVDLACEGKYRSTFHQYQSEIDESSLHNHLDSFQLVPADGNRGIASQIFQVGALNLMYSCKHQIMHYSQGEPDDYSESGDLLLNKRGKKLDDAPDSSPGWLQKAENEIAGQESPAWIISATEQDGESIKVNNERNLEHVLQNAKSEGNLPIAILVFTDHEPLRSESGAHGKENGNAHILNISNYVPGNERCVFLDNEWDSKADHFYNRALTLKETFQLTQVPTMIRLLRATGLFFQ